MDSRLRGNDDDVAIGEDMVRKQFIAGARCPTCNAEDRVRHCRDSETGREWMECVACGYESENPGAPEHPHPEPAAGVVRFRTKD